MKKFCQNICDRLNLMMPATAEDVPKLNDILHEMYDAGCDFYTSRKIFLKYWDDDEGKNKLFFTDTIEFVPSDDMEEHPGIVMKYKNKYESY